MSHVKFFYGSSADPLTKHDKGPNGLGCPVSTEYVTMNMEEDRQPLVNIDEINESGPELYRKLGDIAKT